MSASSCFCAKRSTAVSERCSSSKASISVFDSWDFFVANSVTGGPLVCCCEFFGLFCSLRRRAHFFRFGLVCEIFEETDEVFAQAVVFGIVEQRFSIARA